MKYFRELIFKYKVSDFIEKYKYHLCFIAVGIVYFFNLFIDIMEVDAAQFASISREMIKNGSYLEVYQHGQDYLDKPPLLFWLASFSMKLFGVSNQAYKLPALLVIVAGIYATYGFAKIWYSQKTAVIAALILSTTQAFLLITNDVRTDGILTGFVMLSIWQLSLFLRNNKIINLLFGSLTVGAAMLSKGPIGMIIVALAIGGDLLIKRQFKNIFKPQWLILAGVVGITLIPMCIGLYQQFDLHPEKEVYGIKGPSGLKFFFWTQSFGRITGESSWNNHSGFLYFFQTILWDFQPWILFLIPALFSSIRKLFVLRLKGISTNEYITLSGFVLTFAALSLSSYKLPHYIFPIFPFIAIITANYIVSIIEKNNKYSRFLSNLHLGFITLFFIAPFLSFSLFFPVNPIVLPVVVIVLFLLFCLTIKVTKSGADRVVFPTVIAAFAFGLVLSTYFYPSLLKYQSESVVGKEIYRNKISPDQFYSFKAGSFSLDFYTQSIVYEFDINKIDTYGKGINVYTNSAGKDEILEKSGDYKISKTFDDFHITGLKLPFLLKKTRGQAIKETYLLVKEK